ncbi:MAG: hypothetical protein ACE5EC_02255 [Phycisphaerae bacterium]
MIQKVREDADVVETREWLESLEAVRRFFEVDGVSIVVAALSLLARRGEVSTDVVSGASEAFELDADRPDPARW